MNRVFFGAYNVHIGFQNILNDLNWSKMVQNLPKIVKNCQNYLKCSIMAQNGPKWSKMVHLKKVSKPIFFNYQNCPK